MAEPPYLPPNPREAKRRSQPVQWSFFPLTVAMIAVSVLVGLFSRLGDDTRRVDWMYLSTHPGKAELRELQQMQKELESSDRPDPAVIREFEAAVARLNVLSAPDPLADLKKGQVWRLVTPIFLHFGPIHLLFNMMWLWQLGQVLEARYGTLRFGLLIVAVAVCSNLAQGLVSGPGFGGMSGVIYGLFGFVFAYSKLHPAATLQLNPQVFRFMLFWLVLCFTGLVGPVANTAHLVGLFSGAAIGALGGLRGGGWEMLKRRQHFRQAVSSARASSLHRCVVCGRTEHDEQGSLEFRISSDGEEYCLQHLSSAPPRLPGA